MGAASRRAAPLEYLSRGMHVQLEAICRQAGILNTHTRYLHEGILDYVEKLTGTMAPSLDTAVLTCTGSEANDIALRMAEAVTGKRGIVATDAT